MSHGQHSDSDDSGDDDIAYRIVTTSESDPAFATPAPPGFAPPKPKKNLSDNFIPSATFTGPKVGFIYKDGPLGKGFYKDLNFSNTNSGGSAPSAPKAPSSKKTGKMSGVDMLALLRQKEKEASQQSRGLMIPKDDEDEE
eukprot:c39336_g1_i1.p1 GENE.c39336_g1_i1~~c39336_g1_i1.p1  ORF type:complete len:140 (+),score=31.77 c39336_g1_i1:41-460(+)